MYLSDIGFICIVLALVLAAFAASATVFGSRRRGVVLRQSGYRGIIAVAVLTTFAVVLMEASILRHDFGVRFVSETTSRAMTKPELISALWGGQSGSLLFWSWMLSLFAALVVLTGKRQYPTLLPDAAATLAVIEIFFLALLVFAANPFERLPFPPGDGQGLNPLLRERDMRIHPPLLLAGFVSFSIPFAFAVAALVQGKFGAEWQRAVRRWMLVAWTIQGLGLLAGMWWAYHVLSWGGYWGWDPVENVALLPWLTATALVHSLMVEERRRMLKVWNLALVCASFLLAIFGTFVVRSGILTSVHSFAKSNIGLLFFIFLGGALVVSLALIMYRLPLLSAEGKFDAFTSKEAAFLLNNFILVAIAIVTFWGTIFPLVSEALRGQKVAVGPPFYEQVNGPLFLALLVLMAIGPLLAWRSTARGKLLRLLRGPGLVAALLTLGLVALGIRHPLALVATLVALVTPGIVVQEFLLGLRARGKTGESYPRRLWQLVRRTPRRYGGYIVHAGVALIAIGVIGSGFFQRERSVTLAPGEVVTVAGYSVRYNGLRYSDRPDVSVVAADLTVSGRGADTVLRPEQRIYRGWEQQPARVIDVRTMVPTLDDVYILLSGWTDDGKAVLRVLVNPLVVFIWIGGLLYIAGALVTLWPERAWQGVDVRQSAAVPAGVPAVTTGNGD